MREIKTDSGVYKTRIGTQNGLNLEEKQKAQNDEYIKVILIFGSLAAAFWFVAGDHWVKPKTTQE